MLESTALEHVIKKRKGFSTHDDGGDSVIGQCLTSLSRVLCLRRNRLTYEQFSAFLVNIKQLNAHHQSREVSSHSIAILRIVSHTSTTSIVSTLHKPHLLIDVIHFLVHIVENALLSFF